MIITELHGRLGNSLFMMALGLYISKQLNVEFAVKPRQQANIERINYYPDEIFPYEFFNGLTKLNIDYDTSAYKKIMNPNKYQSYKDFPIEDNLIIKDWFISKNYVNYNVIKDIYVPSKQLKEEIFDLYNPTRNTLMINIRRGDFLWQYNIDRGWHSEPKEYWESVYKYLDKKYDKVLITSDDTEWCKNNLDFCNNIVIVDKKTENSKIFFDLFLPTFVGDNVISASTFSWWGAYLNQNPNKTIVMPYPWKTNDILSGDKYYFDNTIKFDIYNYKEVK